MIIQYSLVQNFAVFLLLIFVLGQLLGRTNIVMTGHLVLPHDVILQINSRDLRFGGTTKRQVRKCRMTMSASSVVTSPNFLEHALLMLLSHKLDTPVRAGAGVRTGPPVT